MAGEIKKVLFSEGLNVETPTDVPFSVESVTGILPKANGGTGISSTATFPASGTVATTADITAAFEGKKFKDPVLLATTANITLSGEQTIDGTLTSASRVLVKDQTLSENNGIYVSAAGAWARASDANAWDELTSAIVAVEKGTLNLDTGWWHAWVYCHYLDSKA
jgi:phage-related tail fiber protein